ncbi:MAG: hypothetical protein SGARI_004353 [Bacillariaceae sp.]
MSSHIWTNDEAQGVFQSIVDNGISQSQDNDSEVAIMGESIETLEDAFSSINRQLTPAFGLEIVTMVGTEDSNDGTPTKYHAVVNTQSDEISKKISFVQAYTPHERAFIRLLLQEMVEAGNTSESSNNNSPDFSLKRKDCINLRSKLENGFKVKVDEAERIVQVLLDEAWLRVSTRQEDDDDNHNDDDDDDDDSISQSQQAKKKKKKRNRRRESVQNKLELAPRAYLELSHYLQDLGMDPEDLPQFLSHKD